MNNTINTIDLINYIQNSQTEKAISLNQAYDLFMNYKAIHNRKGTCKAYKEVAKPLFRYFASHKILFTNQVTSEVIDTYVRERITQVKPITINKEMIILNAIYNFLIKKELIDRSHYTYEKLKTTKTRIPSISEEDVNKCLHHLSNHFHIKYRLAFTLILTTGVRTTELVNIQNCNIDIENKRILLDFTKNGKPRYLYIVDQLVNLIQTVKSDKTYLFNDEEGNQMTANNIRLFFKHLKAQLNIEFLSPHKLRHFYATNLYKKSLDIYLVSKLLGHADTKTTEIYLDLNEHDNQLKNQFYNPLNDLDPLTL